MSTSLFSEGLEIESMFSPAPLSDAEDIRDFFSIEPSITINSPDGTHRGQATNRNKFGTLSRAASVRASLKNESTADVKKPDPPAPALQPRVSLYTLPASPKMSTAPTAATSFSPSTILVSPEEVTPPEYDFAGWDPSAMDNPRLLKHDGSYNEWTNASEGVRSPTTTRNANLQQRFGQITPPDDMSPKTPVSPEPIAYGEESMDRSADRPPARQGSGTVAGKRRSTRSSESTFEPSASAPAPKRSRKSRRSTKTSAGTTDPEEVAKRERFLERNRVAASKCRMKKKESTSHLEDKEREQKAINAYLKQCVAQLKEELLYLKGECLRHSNCDCVAIRDHMASTIPTMQRPMYGLYDMKGPFGDSIDDASNMPWTMEDPARQAEMSQRRPSSGTHGSHVEEDVEMRELLAADLIQDMPE